MDTGDMKTKKKFHIDTTSLNFPKAGMEVSTYMRDGMITDWDMFEQVLDYSYKKIIQSQSEYHPVLFSEAPWNKKDRREQLCEIMFEKYNVPAFFLVKNAVLSAFANGRSTGKNINIEYTRVKYFLIEIFLLLIFKYFPSCAQLWWLTPARPTRARCLSMTGTCCSTPSSSLRWVRTS